MSDEAIARVRNAAAVASAHERTHTEARTADVLALLDALDTADEPGRAVETPEGLTFHLVCGACASGWGCRAHPDGWDEPRTAEARAYPGGVSLGPLAVGSLAAALAPPHAVQAAVDADEAEGAARALGFASAVEHAAHVEAERRARRDAHLEALMRDEGESCPS